MQFINFRLLATGALVVLFAWNCNKSASTAPEEPTGSISVNIASLDEFGAAFSTKAGVTVTVSGGGQVVSNSTDANGDATFTGLKYAAYTVTAQKTGFETFSGDNYALSSDNQGWFISRSITQLPTVTVDSLAATVNATLQQVLVGGKFSTATPSGKNRYYVLYFGNAAVNHSLSAHQYSSDFGTFGSTTFTSSNVYTSLKSNGFTSGGTVYVTARAASHPNGFTDATTGRFVYTAIETLSTLKKSFVLP